jgi:hypothetical protein
MRKGGHEKKEKERERKGGEGGKKGMENSQVAVREASVTSQLEKQNNNYYYCTGILADIAIANQIGHSHSISSYLAAVTA